MSVVLNAVVDWRCLISWGRQFQLPVWSQYFVLFLKLGPKLHNVVKYHWRELPQLFFLSQQKYVCCNKTHLSSRQTQHMFAATKVILVAAPANDGQNFSWCSHIQMHGDQYRVLVYSPSIPTNRRLEVRVPHLYLDCCFEIHFQLKAVKSCTMRGPTESFSDCWRYMLKEQSTVCGPTESFNCCWRYMLNEDSTMCGPTESYNYCWRYMLNEDSTMCGPTESYNHCWRYMPKWRY